MSAMPKPGLELMAEALLPLMDDQRTFDEPVPACTAVAHDWSIIHDKTITGRDAIAAWSVTYPVAIVCAHCDLSVGFS